MGGGVGNFTRAGLVGAALCSAAVGVAVRAVVVLVHRSGRAGLQQLEKLVQQHSAFLGFMFIIDPKEGLLTG